LSVGFISHLKCKIFIVTLFGNFSFRTVVCVRLLFFLLLLSCAGCSKPPEAQAEFVLGTICSVNLYQQGSQKVYRELFSRLHEIENRMSTNKAATDVDLINKNAGIEPVLVHEDVREVIEKAVFYAELSDGAFDPTVGPLVHLWDIGSETPRLPSEHEIKAALDLVNWQDVIIDREAGTVFLARSGMALDLGGIAKGYAADEAVRIIKQTRIPGAIIDLGGNIFAYGSKDKDSQGKRNAPWRIGVQNPLDTRGAYIGVIETKNKSIVTSGIYERYMEFDGKRYHHLLSTKDGYPVDNGLLSVTIITDFSIDADALSTVAFTLGYEKADPLIKSLDNTEAIFVFTDKSIRLTPGAKDLFVLSNAEYHITDR
jgi:thiamine biosynthesis lipoprotein